MFYVYVLENNDKTLYIGFSSNLKQRLKDHNTGKSRYTRNKGTWRLIYYEAYTEKLDAIGREKFLKGGSGRKYINKQLRQYFDKKHLAG